MAKNKSRKRARVLIVDDHPAIREALSLRIDRQPDLAICGEATDIADALRLVAAKKPDAAVVDLSLKTGSGIDLIKRIRDCHANVRILVWSMHNESFYARRALRAGALGYISKDEATDRIVDAIRRVLQGKIWLSEAMSESILQRTVSGPHSEIAPTPLDTLADREMEVFRLIGEGVKTRQIAGRLHLSIKTVETYRDRIRQKLDLGDGTELAHVATQWVLENP
jgi:DNA-binding NarL/FixJ family response regulator